MTDDDDVDIVGEYSGDTILSAGGYNDEMGGLALNELLPYLGPNSWLLNSEQVWCMNSNPDAKTKSSSERNCIKHEECLPIFKHPKSPAEEKSAVVMPKQKRPWTPLEKELFQKGLGLFGNRWTKISKHIGTRTTLQVKNFARQYLKQCKDVERNFGSANASDNRYERISADLCCVNDTASSPRVSTCGVTINQKQLLNTENQQNDAMYNNIIPSIYSEEVVRINKYTDSGESEDVDIEDMEDPPKNVVDISHHRLSPTSHGHKALDNLNPPSITDVPSLQRESSNAVRKSGDKLCSTKESLKTDTAQDFPEEFVGKFEEQRVFTFKKPDAECRLARDVIVDEEKIVHHEFFEGRPQKTPERYVKIRNYILDSWLKCKPCYLNKTSVRPGLKNCGDVNCIGRIHSYLEQIGAINFGCEQTVYNRPLFLLDKPMPVPKRPNPDVTVVKQLTMRSRKRKAPVLKFDSEAGGYTIEHDKHGEIVDIADGSKAPATKRSKIKKRNTKNPFQLVTCASFTDSDPAPFSVEVDARALVVMDIHAHLSSLEVIGLLGGNYDKQSLVLRVTHAEPCESLSTGQECEMDPVSQTQASEKLQQLGCRVVGWYHSHPTFSPNPSLRDLETQSKFQEWFGQGGYPFLGVIVSPRYSSAAGSKVRYLIVGEGRVLPDGHRMPFEFSPTLKCLGNHLGTLVTDIEKIICKWLPTINPCSDARVPLATVNKLIASVHHHLTTAQDDQPAILSFLGELGRIIVAHLQSTTRSQTDTSDVHPEIPTNTILDTATDNSSTECIYSQ